MSEFCPFIRESCIEEGCSFYYRNECSLMTAAIWIAELAEDQGAAEICGGPMIHRGIPVRVEETGDGKATCDHCGRYRTVKSWVDGPDVRRYYCSGRCCQADEKTARASSREEDGTDEQTSREEGPGQSPGA